MTVPATDTPATPGRRPEPVLGAAAVASGLTSLAGLVLLVLVLAHVLTPEGQAVLGPALAAAVPSVVGAVGTLAAAWHARGKVTPLSDPMTTALTSAGTVLVELVEAGETVATAVTEARRAPGKQTPGVADHAAPGDTGPTGG